MQQCNTQCNNVTFNTFFLVNYSLLKTEEDVLQIPQYLQFFYAVGQALQYCLSHYCGRQKYRGALLLVNSVASLFVSSGKQNGRDVLLTNLV